MKIICLMCALMLTLKIPAQTGIGTASYNTTPNNKVETSFVTKRVRNQDVITASYENAIRFARMSKDEIGELLKKQHYTRSGVDDNFSHYYGTVGLQDGAHVVFITQDGGIIITWTDLTEKHESIMQEDMEALKKYFWKHDTETGQFIYRIVDPKEAGEDRYAYIFKFRREGSYESCTITFKAYSELK